jgi:hypothetical protein
MMCKKQRTNQHPSACLNRKLCQPGLGMQMLRDITSLLLALSHAHATPDNDDASLS